MRDTEPPIRPPKFYHKLSFKIILSVLAVLLIIISIINHLHYSSHRNELIKSLKGSTNQMSTLLKRSLEYNMLMNDRRAIKETVMSLSGEEGVENVLVLNKKGIIRIAPREEMVGRSMEKNDPTCQICHRLKPENRGRTVIFATNDGRRVFRNVNPIANRRACWGCHRREDKINGVLIIDYSMQNIDALLRRSKKNQLIWTFGTLLTLAGVLSLLINEMVI
ncbi:MAG: hypothetical protein ACE5LX_09665, partial [Nitrospinota bacterium]